jgi:hypothetical protein
MRNKFLGLSPEMHLLFDKMCRERGIPKAPPEHWIYQEGASTFFIPPRLKGNEQKPSKTKEKNK